MKYAYYPGCSLHSTSREYDMSAKEVSTRLGIELIEVPDWVCCGATPAHVTMHVLSQALPVKSLINAKQTGADTMAVCCAACFSRLKIANYHVLNDPGKKAKINRAVGAEYNGEVAVKHLLEILAKDFGLENLKGKMTAKLDGLKVACYYGCLLVRPRKIMQFDDEENPTIMDAVVETTGAKTVDWPGKVECCGASFSITKTGVVLRLCRDILQLASDAGAECIAVACPLCQSNLDLRQPEVNKKYDKKFDMPVLYFTQILGLAMGIDWKKLGLDKHIVSPLKFLKGKNIIK